jgi:hypothetical protein
MKVRLVAILVCCIVTAVAFLAIEGAYALTRGTKPAVSLSFQALETLGLAHEKRPRAVGAYAPYFNDPAELTALIGPLTDASVGVGNSPIKELQSENAAINTVVDGCMGMTPNLRKTAFYLRSNAFNPFDPITVFFDEGKPLDAPVAAFFDRYGTPPVTLSTNDVGERMTLPAIERPRKVLIAGDSVAFGAMVDDHDTIASQMQARDPARQYVNLGVAGVEAAQIVCRLEAAMRRYAGQVDELIYVYCENDFSPKLPYGKPEEVIEWLSALAAREAIDKVTVVFAPYIYTIAPEVSRFDGYPGGKFPARKKEREALMQAVEAAGFGWVDIGLLAREAQTREKSEFALFALFVDHVHLSPQGTTRLVDALTVR